MNQTALSGPELAAAMKVGTRVVRGADWAYHDQDGIPPAKGTVVSINPSKTYNISVMWDRGSQNVYRMGPEGKYDLKPADPLPAQQQQSGTATGKCCHCKETVDSKDLLSHEKKCLNKPVKCLECAHIVALKNWYEHQCQATKKGETATGKCCHCKETVDSKDLLSHEKKCLNKPVKCPECADIVALKNWYEHQCQTTKKETEKLDSAAEKLAEDLGNILNKKEYTDVTIKVKDKEFQLHKNILTGRSPYFDSMFKTEMKEKSTNMVLIDDCEPDIFDSFIYFVYTGQIKELSGDNVCGIYMIADKYQEKELKAKCLNFMKNNITVDSFCDFIALALRHDEKELLKDTTEFFCRKTNEIIQSVKWQVFMKNYTTQANELFIKAYNAK